MSQKAPNAAVREAASSTVERRFVAFDELRVERGKDKSPPRIIGHAAVFNSRSEDLGGFREVIAAGAFIEAIEKDDVRCLFNHDPNLILGRNVSKTLTMREDSRGLAIECTPPDTTYARDLLISLERGDVSQMSFAFTVRPGGQDWAKDDDGLWIRTVKKCRLFDVSPVTYPAYTATDVGLAVRSLEEHMRAHQQIAYDPEALATMGRRLRILEAS